MLTRLQDDATLRAEYANRAYQRALKRYTTDRMVDDYMTLYSSLSQTGALAA